MTHFVSLASVVIASILFSGIAVTAQEGAVAAPSVKVNEFLEFKLRNGARTRTEIVEVLSNATHVQSRDRFPGARFIRDEHLTTIRIEGPFSGDEGGFVGWALLNFPLHVGKRYSFDVVGVGKVPLTIDMHVAAHEDIRTEGGTMRALRLESCWKDKRLAGRACGVTYWYAPAAKGIVKRESPRGFPGGTYDGDFEVVRAHVLE
jgi:hypothetical protein